MSNVAVGRIVDLDKYRTPPPVCYRCLLLEKAIREYLDGYASRRMHEEGLALIKLKAVLGE